MSQQPISLDDLAKRFSALHYRVKEATANALAAALDAGDILVEVRRRVPNGGWFQWLKRHRIPLSTAKLYVQLAQNRSKIEAELHRLGDLSLRAARKLIAGPRASSSSRSDRKATLDKSTQLLVKAILLVVEPGTNNIEAGHSEAIATLHVLYNVLVAHGIDLNDIAISASKGTTQQRRKAA